MFKRHVYTCPDVIHIRSRNKRNQLAIFGVYVLSLGGLWVYGDYLERQEKKDRKDNVRNIR